MGLRMRDDDYDEWCQGESMLGGSIGMVRLFAGFDS